ncbi:hypothetical protein [Pontibacter oryzae]|uniref:Uncharacterized protein n=1 Tax=Pontibacter oryzae TaxID=2304593 RepID=A0A399RY27_9BACT|nr:hypothetical protein [Pontibacter oryzae]RIJ36666.1 hypothetical protein D1627_12535 [Pontibacter oryzae]
MTFTRHLVTDKLKTSAQMVTNKLLPGEQHLIQTVDKRIALTTHRLILRKFSWARHHGNAVMLEDISDWEVKATGVNLYVGLSIASALLVYLNDAFFLLSGFFLALFIMTRRQRIHVRTNKGNLLVLPLDVHQKRLHTLIPLIKEAQQNRMSYLMHHKLKVA